MMTTDIADRLAALGRSTVSPKRLDLLVSRCLGQDVRVTDVDVVPVDYPDGSIATGALMRCVGRAVNRAGEERGWSIFVKQLQSARVWPFLEVIPEPYRASWVAGFPWRIEIDSYRSRIAELLPSGMRLPLIYDIAEIDDDRAAIWMEDVRVSDAVWTAGQFVAAARGLGELAGRRPLGSDVVFEPADGSDQPNASLRMFALGRIRMGIGSALADDTLWKHPALVAALADAGEPGLRDELRTAMGRLDDWLAELDALPQTYVHGDASPQNLLVPAADPGTFVVIDFGFNSPHCVGFDLGQLLVGLVHAGRLPASRLAELFRLILPPYTDGLLGTGFSASAAEIRRGFTVSLVVRSLFTAVPLEQLGRPDSAELRALIADRIQLTRFLLDLARTG